jgi:phytoene synthase
MSRAPRAAAPALPASAAIRYCEDVTRREAKNFWYGVRLLPVTKRRILATVYALSRRIDDIGDGDLPAAEKLVALDGVERSLDAIDPHSSDPVLAALGEVLTVCPLPVQALRDLVAGVRMDVQGVSYERFTDLVPYCRRVAGSVGRVSLAVFQVGNVAVSEEAEALADDLGVALQLTNILRDVREDFGNGRIYLPAEDLRQFALEPGDLGGPPSSRTSALIRFEAARAQEWFARGLRLMPLLDRRSAASAGAMAGIYARLLERIAENPEAVFSGRLSLPTREKVWVAVRALTARRASPAGRP